MRVTLVTVYYAPEISPVTHLYRDLAEDLALCGAEVTVVTGLANRGLSDEMRAAYRDRTDERTPEGIHILRVGGGSEGKNLLHRGLYLLASTFALYRAAKRTPTDVYLLGSMPPFLGVVGAKLGKRARTVYILQDIFPDTVQLMNRLPKKGLLTGLCRMMERVTYRGNTRFITISEDMARTLTARGVSKERIDVIGNWADTDAIMPVPRERNPLFDELAIPRDKCIVLYAGVLGILQNPDVLLDAAKLLADVPDLLFVIFGEGALRGKLAERMEREKLTNVRLFPLQPASRVSEVYSVGDIAVVPLKKGVTNVATPSKTWTAMAAGRPVIVTADAGSAWAETVAAADCGAIVPPEDAAALARTIRELYEQRATLSEKGAHARAYVEKHLARKDATKRYFEVLSKE